MNKVFFGLCALCVVVFGAVSNWKSTEKKPLGTVVVRFSYCYEMQLYEEARDRLYSGKHTTDSNIASEWFKAGKRVATNGYERVKDRLPLQSCASDVEEKQATLIEELIVLVDKFGLENEENTASAIAFLRRAYHRALNAKVG